MPERKGVLNIDNEHLRRRDAKAKRSSAEISSGTSRKFREQRNRAPFRRSAPAPTPFPNLALPAARAQSYAAQSFQQLKCASAQLCCSQLAHLKDFALGAAKPPRWLSQAPTPLIFTSAKQNSDGESRSRVHFERFQWLAAPFPSRFPFSTPKSRSRAAP